MSTFKLERIRWLERVFVVFPIFYMNMEMFCLEGSDVEHGLNTNFLIYIMVCLGNKEF